MKTIFILVSIFFIVVFATENTNREKDIENIGSKFDHKNSKLQVKRDESTLESPESNDKLAGSSSIIKLSTPLVVLIAVLIFLSIPFNT